MQVSELYKIFKQSTGICTDTRKVEKGNLFFALKGPNFNANKLADEALKNGAIAAVIDDSDFDEGDNYILVNDGLQTLQTLANYHRKQFDIPVIGITGTNGKTTTKELMAAVLETTFKTHYTKGNFNNHIGVPLTLLEMEEDTEIAIIEMGANHIGEIAELCQIAEPNLGIITNIGKAHLEGFGSFEGVARAKSELYLFIKNNGGSIFVNSTDEHLMRMSSRLQNVIKFPEVEDFYTCEFLSSNPFIEFKVNNSTIKTHLFGMYNFYNIATALCIGKYFKVDERLANNAISNFESDNNRSQIIKKHSNTIILDAYNANPSSMKAAILNFEEMEMPNKIVVLGDMFELGAESKEEHTAIGELLAECNFKQSIIIGKEMRYANIVYQQSKWFETKNELVVWLEKEKIKNATILVKGSRGMSLETLIF